MSGEPNIQYLTRRQVDIAKWDACIDSAENGLVYAYSYYLDHMAKNWDALVLNDYEAIMPLTWNKKYGIHYLYQPFLTAQLGVFGKNLTEVQVEQFIRAIPLKFKLIEISLNSGNVFNDPSGWSILRSNYVLGLNKPYEELYQSYRDNIKRNIKKAYQVGCTSLKDFDVEKVIGLALQQMRTHGKESAENVDRFRKLYQLLYARQMATTYGILSPQNELIASCVFFFSLIPGPGIFWWAIIPMEGPSALPMH